MMCHCVISKPGMRWAVASKRERERERLHIKDIQSFSQSVHLCDSVIITIISGYIPKLQSFALWNVFCEVGTNVFSITGRSLCLRLLIRGVDLDK